MAVSASRWVVRATLVIILVGVAYLAAQNYLNRGPNYYWRRAQTAMARNDSQEAMRLLRVLHAHDPNHAEGNRALAQLYLDDAQANNPKARYATEPRALKHLKIAARLNPNDFELQKTVLAAQLEARHLFEANTTARLVIRADSQNEDAMFALAWDEIEKKRYRSAEDRITEMERAGYGDRFRTMALKTHLAVQTKDYDGAKDTLNRFTTIAVSMPTAELANISNQERFYLDQMLSQVVSRADDLATAQLRASDAISVLDKLMEAEYSKYSDLERNLPVDVQGVDRRKVKEESPSFQEAEDNIREVAEGAARVTISLHLKREGDNEKSLRTPFGAVTPATRNVAAKMKRIGTTALAVQDVEVSPVVYYATAQAHIALGEDGEALEVLNAGLGSQQAQGTNNAEMMLELHRTAAFQLAIQGRYDDAGKHIDALLANDDTAGIAHFVAGAIDRQADKNEKAVEHFRRAQQMLGDVIAIKCALVDAYFQLERWRDMLPLAESLHLKDLDQLDPFDRAQYERVIGNDGRLHVMQVAAYLGLGYPDDAERHLKALRGTDHEADAMRYLYDYLYKRNSAKIAYDFLIKAREQFPKDEELFKRQVNFLEDHREYEAAGTVTEEYYARFAKNTRELLLPVEYWQEVRRDDKALTYIDRMRARLPEDATLLQMKSALLSDRKRYDEALDALTEMQRIMPDHALPRMLKAQVYKETSNPSLALEALNKALALQPEHHASRMLRIEILLEMNQPMAAFQEASTLVKQDDRNWEARLKQAEALMALNRRVEAIGVLEHLKTLQPNNAKVYAELSKAYAASNNFSRTSEVLKEAFEALGAENVELNKARIWLLVRANQADQLNEIAPKSAAMCYLKAEAWQEVNRLDKAVEELEKALNIDREHADARLLLAKLRYARGEHPAALAHATAALRQHPLDREAQMIRAQSLVRLNRREEAIETLQRLIATDPKQAQPYLILATILLSPDDPAQADPEAALIVLRAGARALPNDLAITQAEVELLVRLERREELDEIARNNPEVHYYKAQAWRNRNRLDDALRELNMALTLKADHIESRIMAIEVSLALNENQGALDHVNEALRRHGSLWNLFQLKATALTRLDREPEAVHMLEELIAKQPLTVGAYITLARTQSSDDNHDAALDTIRSGLEKMPENVRLVQEEINLLIDQGRDDELAKLGASSPQVSYFKSLAWRSRNRLDKAMFDLEQCLNLQPNHLPARVMAAELALARNDNQAALNHANQSLLLDPHLVAAELIRADAYRRLGLNVEALQLLERLLQNRPRLAGAYTRLAEVQMDVDNPEAALSVARRGRAQMPGSMNLVQVEVRVLCKLGRVEEAVRLAEAVAGDEPSFAVCQNVAQAFLAGKEYDLALTWAKKAEKYADEFQEVQAHATLGTVLMTAGMKRQSMQMLADARSHFSTVLKAEPHDYPSANNYAWLLSQYFDEPEVALDVLAKVRGDMPLERLPAAFTDTLCRVYRYMERLDDAEKVLETAMAVHPYAPELHYQKGHIHLTRKEHLEARNAFQEAVALGLNGDDIGECKRLLSELGKMRLPLDGKKADDQNKADKPAAAQPDGNDVSQVPAAGALAETK